MKTLAPIALLSLLLAGPALAGSISVDMPNLSFPHPAPTISTAGCDATAQQQECRPQD